MKKKIVDYFLIDANEDIRHVITMTGGWGDMSLEELQHMKKEVEADQLIGCTDDFPPQKLRIIKRTSTFEVVRSKK